MEHKSPTATAAWRHLVEIERPVWEGDRLRPLVPLVLPGWQLCGWSSLEDFTIVDGHGRQFPISGPAYTLFAGLVAARHIAPI